MAVLFSARGIIFSYCAPRDGNGLAMNSDGREEAGAVCSVPIIYPIAAYIFI